MKLIYSLITAAVMALCGASCSKSVDVKLPGGTFRNTNGIYYWKTVFRCDSAEQEFLQRHRVGKIYLRMFDVIKNPNLEYTFIEGDYVIPNATVKIGTDEYFMMSDPKKLAKEEIVPVVYITLDALVAMQGYEAVLAENIVTRVNNMSMYNDLPNVKEIQLDCDWTASTQDSFFKLCREVERVANQEQQLNWRLSSTIRLHQLSRKAPPVDYGVLMVYNTGNFNDPNIENSIIDEDDVEPYLKHLSQYPLYLDIAYPTYSWQLRFQAGEFAGILSDVNLADTTLFRKIRTNTYVVKKDIPYNNTKILRGDIVREEISEYKNILRVKELIEEKMGDRPHNNILYHLDITNLSKFTDDEIDNLYTTSC